MFQGENELTESLLKRLNKSGKVHMVPAALKGKYVIRFTVTSQYTDKSDIERDWKIISNMATTILRDEEYIEEDYNVEDRKISKQVEPIKIYRNPSLKRKEYGMSLLLSNVPMSPKLINGSFAALFDNNDVIVEYAKQITNSDFNGRPIRLSPRRRIKLRDQNKQQSLDFFTVTKQLPSRFKQASLDSKVEQILEESVRHDQANGLPAIEIINESETDQESSFNEDDDGELVEGVKEEEFKLIEIAVPHRNGQLASGTDQTTVKQGQDKPCLICKHCGNRIDE